jgi:hypothetical protein
VEELEHRERSSTGVSPPNKMRTPLPGTMPQLCLTIMPFEMIASIGRKEGLGRVAAEAKEDTESGKSLSQVLHQQRRPINYFAVDCRPADAMSSGKFPTAYHLDPATLQDPDKISKVLVPLVFFSAPPLIVPSLRCWKIWSLCSARLTSACWEGERNTWHRITA